MASRRKQEEEQEEELPINFTARHKQTTFKFLPFAVDLQKQVRVRAWHCQNFPSIHNHFALAQLFFPFCWREFSEWKNFFAYRARRCCCRRPDIHIFVWIVTGIGCCSKAKYDNNNKLNYSPSR